MIAGLKLRMQRAIDEMEKLHQEYEKPLVITEAFAVSGHLENSKHYTGEAIDIRIWHLGDEFRKTARKIVTDFNLVNREFGFQAILEKTHIHIEYDKDTRL